MHTLALNLGEYAAREERATWSRDHWAILKLAIENYLNLGEIFVVYLMSIWKFWDRSAARLVVGEEPRIPFNEKYSGPVDLVAMLLKLKFP